MDGTDGHRIGLVAGQKCLPRMQNALQLWLLLRRQLSSHFGLRCQEAKRLLDPKKIRWSGPFDPQVRYRLGVLQLQLKRSPFPTPIEDTVSFRPDKLIWLLFGGRWQVDIDGSDESSCSSPHRMFVFARLGLSECLCLALLGFCLALLTLYIAITITLGGLRFAFRAL